MPLKDVRKIRIPFVRVMGWRPTSSREIMIYINTLHTQLPGRHLTQDATQLTISYTFHFFTHYIFLNILMYLKQLIPPYIIFIPSHQNSDMYHALHPTPRFPFIITPPPTTPNKSLNTPNTPTPNTPTVSVVTKEAHKDLKGNTRPTVYAWQVLKMSYSQTPLQIHSFVKFSFKTFSRVCNNYRYMHNLLCSSTIQFVNQFLAFSFLNPIF